MSENEGGALDRLRGDLSLRRDGVAIVVDALLRQTVRDLVDPAVFVDVVSRAAEATFLERLLTEHLEPGIERVLEGLEGSTLGDLLPEGEAEAIEALVVGATPPTLEWMVGAVDPPEGSVEEDSLVDEASAIKDVAREVNNNHNKILILMLAEDLK